MIFLTVGTQFPFDRLVRAVDTACGGKLVNQRVFGQVGDTFTFNARPSSDDTTPDGALMVRWDLTGDGNWNTPLSTDKVVTRTVNLPGVYTVTLEVWDLAWLTDTISYRVWAFPATGLDAPSAQALTATLPLTPALSGTAGDLFEFDGSGSTGTGQLLARWDWENDGEFDTGFSPVLTASHTYTVAGEHTVRLEIRDDSLLSDAALKNVTVLPGIPTTLQVFPAEAQLIPDQVLAFRASAWDAYDNRMYHPEVAWSLTDATAGAIDAGGVFTAGLHAGTYPGVIRAESYSLIDTASLTIFYPYQIYVPLILRNSP